MASMRLPVASLMALPMASATALASRGNSFTRSSSALLLPSRPYWGLQPLPSTGAVSRSSRPSTTLAPAAANSRLLRRRVWMSQVITVSV